MRWRCDLMVQKRALMRRASSFNFCSFAVVVKCLSTRDKVGVIAEAIST